MSRNYRPIFVWTTGFFSQLFAISKKIMRKFRAFVLLLCLHQALLAQLPSGAIVPNFTTTDLNGQSWDLYNLLDQGKIVVLEISATWCPPCWAYHNGHAMHKFYEQHGPDGDNKARVLFVEGDPATNVNCLYGTSGCNNYTPGNWVAGTPFPIINDAAIADSFKVNYYPSIYVICPNRKAYEIGQWNAADIWDQALTCPVAAGNNNAGIFNYNNGTPLHEVCETLELQPAFSIVNLGSNALTQATVALKWENTIVQTIEWTGNLGLYGEIPVTFDPLPVTTAGQLETQLTSINNNPVDDDPSNNTLLDSFSTAKEFNSLQVLLKLRTDQYGAETYWELRDENGAVLESGGNQDVGPNGGGKFTGINSGPGAYGNNHLIRDTFFLPEPGCYSFHIVDAYGDGMCCDYGNGYYKLYNLDNPINPLLWGGVFKAYDDRAFSTAMLTAANEPYDNFLDLQLFPNPAREQITLDFELPNAARTTVFIVNTLGQLVQQTEPEWRTAGTHQLTLPINHLPAGMYWLQFQAGAQRLSRKFLVQK